MADPRDHQATIELQTVSVTVAGDGRPTDSDHLPAGSEVGPYRIERLLGRGGMGEVYLAEQQRPVVRHVALKLLPAESMSSRRIAWFSIESQLLASMQHPAIAQIHDAGTTDQGQPFFAMEYVDGQTLTRYCKQRRLSVCDRLALFIRICQGVQHAHQRGIIHRDLKPANILVAEVDGIAQPKIIDFGVGTAIETALGTVAQPVAHPASLAPAGTPEYMSPEQGSTQALKPDSRSDVYSLGRVLYELISEQLPRSDGSLFRSRDQQARTPHSKLQISGLETRIQRQILAGRGRLWGRNWLLTELDWIIQRATELDRDRRYASAGELADDLQRLIETRPLLAAPAGHWYPARKFLARHRTMVASIGAVAIATVAGLALATAGFLQASEQRDQAEQARAMTEAVNQFLVQDILSVADIEVSADGGDITVRQALLNARDRIAERFAGEPLIEAGVRQSLALSLKGMGDMAAAQEQYEIALALRQQTLGPSHPDTLTAAHEVASMIQRTGDFEQTEAMFLEILQTRSDMLGARHPDTLKTLSHLGVMYWQFGRYQQALPVTEQALELALVLHAEPHREIYVPMHNLGRLYRALDRAEDAVPLMERALAGRIELFGEDSLIALESRNDLAGLYRGLGRHDEAAEMYEGIVDVYKRIAGLRHGSTLIGMNNLARVYADMNRHEQTVELLNYVVEHADQAFGDQNWHGAAFQMNLASSLIELNQPNLALEWLQRARPLIEKTFPADHGRVRALNEHEQRARSLIKEQTDAL